MNHAFLRSLPGIAGMAALLLGTAAFAETPQAGDSYFRAAQKDLAARLTQQPNTGRAKNIILFVGDGMGLSTLTAARIHGGQKQGVDGESSNMAIDALPYTAMVKTYSHDGQVSDSSATATAMVSGVKTRNGVLGVTQDVERGVCAPDKGVVTLFEQAEQAGYATGIVSTARITHATPAATFAKAAERNWENDSELSTEAKAAGCTDIARQLVEWKAGNGFEVVLGGGRANFLPAGKGAGGKEGLRTDGRDLTQDWRRRHNDGVYVATAADFRAVDPRNTQRLMGLFNSSHMMFEAGRARTPDAEPSLEEMTRTAITILSGNDNGFVLMVEAGRIDHAHHAGNAARALEDTLALDAAVKAALEMTDTRDTLVMVTADHSHTMTISGYPQRGNPILGAVVDVDGKPTVAKDGKGYTTLSYANGPGAQADRADPHATDPTGVDFLQAATVPLSSETHAGEDVMMRAIGPQAHLLGGVIEQNMIYHVMAYATGLAAAGE